MELTRKLLDSSAVTLADQRQVTVICSTGEPDRMGDVIVQSGIDLTAYKKNPIVLWGHDADVPIAKAIDIGVKSGKLQATVQFPDEGADEDADWVYGKIKAGIVNAISVGFIPRDYEPIDPKQPWSGFKFGKSELLEFSFVSVPANAGCLIVGRSLLNAVDVPHLPSVAKAAGASATDDVDVPHDVRVPRSELEELFRLAKTPRAVRQKYLEGSAAADCKVNADRDLVIEDPESWDGAAAAKRMLDAAGFDGDNPDAAKAACGFLIQDAANPLLRSSYKLPFADIIDGALKAVKAGIVAAKSRLDQVDAPATIRDEAKAVIDGYEEKFGDIVTAVEKAGRKISTANAAKLREAMDHHASATKCIKDVLDSNATDDPDDDIDDPDIVPTVTVLSAREQRLAEAKALRESANI